VKNVSDDVKMLASLSCATWA